MLQINPHAECHCAVCRFAECRDAILATRQSKSKPKNQSFDQKDISKMFLDRGKDQLNQLKFFYLGLEKAKDLLLLQDN